MHKPSVNPTVAHIEKCLLLSQDDVGALMFLFSMHVKCQIICRLVPTECYVRLKSEFCRANAPLEVWLIGMADMQVHCNYY